MRLAMAAATIHPLIPGLQVCCGTLTEFWDDTVSMDRAYLRQPLLKSAGGDVRLGPPLLNRQSSRAG